MGEGDKADLSEVTKFDTGLLKKVETSEKSTLPTAEDIAAEKAAEAEAVAE